jgi:hypothetical protein
LSHHRIDTRQQHRRKVIMNTELIHDGSGIA